MPSQSKKRIRRPRLSLDPAENRARFKILADKEERAESFIILKLAGERLDQIVAEQAIPLDQVVFIQPDGTITTQKSAVSREDLTKFFRTDFSNKALDDGRTLFFTIKRKPINVRASLSLKTRIAGAAVVGPAHLLP